MKIPMAIICLGMTAILGLQSWVVLAIVNLENQQAVTAAMLEIILKKVTL